MGLYEFEGVRPSIGPDTYIHPEAVLIGNVSIGAGCFIGACVVLRGDFGRIIVGDGSNVQENSVLHAGHVQPVEIAEDVIVGHGVMIHDAIVETGAIIAMGAIILHQARVEAEAFVAAGAVVSPGTVIPKRKLAMGNPARPTKDITDAMLKKSRQGLLAYQELPQRYLKTCRRID